MKLLDKPIEQPWAYANRPGWRLGLPQSAYFQYFKTRELAEKYAAKRDRKGQWHGPIEYRPGESRTVGYV